MQNTSPIVAEEAADNTAPTGTPEGNAPSLPEQIAYAPPAKPVATSGRDDLVAAAAEEEAKGKALDEAREKTASPASAVNEQVATASAPANGDIAAAAPNEQAAAPKKRGFLSSLFSANQASAAPSPAVQKAEQIIAAKPEVTPLVKLASLEPTEQVEISRASSSGSYGSDALPGVRQSALFEIKRKNSLEDDSDVDLHEEDELGPIRIASVGGMARLAPNGLLKQTDSVDTACLKPGLVSTLRQFERKFGRKVVITSGYRSPSYNRKVNGAKRSQHMNCAAADIQIPGVTKFELAAYARTLPGRGGVGTYCHTESVHVDIGPERDWNWRCRRRKA